MAKGIGYLVVARDTDHKMIRKKTFPFNAGGRAEMRSEMVSIAKTSMDDVIVRGSRLAGEDGVRFYTDVSWYCVSWKGEVRFFARNRMSESNRLFLDIAMGRIDEDEMYDKQAEAYD